ncbi:uncharacterized protein METZ01_LOCUS171829, partial [marine metagenome]
VGVRRNEPVEVISAETQLGSDLDVSESMLGSESAHMPLRGV